MSKIIKLYPILGYRAVMGDNGEKRVSALDGLFQHNLSRSRAIAGVGIIASHGEIN